MDPHEREAAAAVAGMAETYGHRLPRVGEDCWYWRDPKNHARGRAVGMVVEVVGQSTPDPIIKLKHTRTGVLVIRKSQIAPPWIPGAAS